jgi:hypothetical protein
MNFSSSRPLPESAVFNMRLLILGGMPPSYRNRHYHNAQLWSAGHDPTHPILIDDSDNEGDKGPSAPTARNLSQARKCMPSSKQGQINTTTWRNKRRSQESSSFGHSQDVYYTDLSGKFPRAENDINTATVVSVATRQCSVCGDSSPIAELPSLTECKHLPQTCSTCYAGWIKVQLQESSWREARCPESTCHVKMTYRGIQQNALVEIFVSFNILLF